MCFLIASKLPPASGLRRVEEIKDLHLVAAAALEEIVQVAVRPRGTRVLGRRGLDRAQHVDPDRLHPRQVALDDLGVVDVAAEHVERRPPALARRPVVHAQHVPRLPAEHEMRALDLDELVRLGRVGGKTVRSSCEICQRVCRPGSSEARRQHQQGKKRGIGGRIALGETCRRSLGRDAHEIDFCETRSRAAAIIENLEVHGHRSRVRPAFITKAPSSTALAATIGKVAASAFKEKASSRHGLGSPRRQRRQGPPTKSFGQHCGIGDADIEPHRPGKDRLAQHERDDRPAVALGGVLGLHQPESNAKADDGRSRSPVSRQTGAYPLTAGRRQRVDGSSGSGLPLIASIRRERSHPADRACTTDRVLRSRAG